jgi:hypothetical protein
MNRSNADHGARHACNYGQQLQPTTKGADADAMMNAVVS